MLSLGLWLWSSNRLLTNVLSNTIPTWVSQSKPSILLTDQLQVSCPLCGTWFVFSLRDKVQKKLLRNRLRRFTQLTLLYYEAQMSLKVLLPIPLHHFRIKGNDFYETVFVNFCSECLDVDRLLNIICLSHLDSFSMVLQETLSQYADGLNRTCSDTLQGNQFFIYIL